MNTTRIITLLGALTIASCTDSFMKAKVRNESTLSAPLAMTQDAAGNYSSSYDPSAGSTQIMRISSGSLSGSGISFPPGSLSIPVSVTVGTGETLASSDTADELGITGNTVSSAGPSVSFSPSSNIEASSPMTLSVPVTTTSLALSSLNTDNIIVMYKWMKVSGASVSYEIGILLRDQVTVGSSSVQFQTTKFGVFQVAMTATPITTQIKKPTIEPPMLKQGASSPLAAVWKTCAPDKTYDYTAAPTTATTSTPPPPPAYGGAGGGSASGTFNFMITTIAGIAGTGSWGGEGVLASTAYLNAPAGITVDGSGNIFFADRNNNRIRRIAASTGMITTFAGVGTSSYSVTSGAANAATLNLPYGVVLNSIGESFIADTTNSAIRKTAYLSPYNISTVAGNGTANFYDGVSLATSSSINAPQGVAVDSAGNIYIADTNNNRIRMVASGTNNISTLAGNGTAGYTGSNTSGTSATSAQISAPTGIWVDSSGANIYFADTGNNCIRRVTSGMIYNVAGLCAGAAGFNGDGMNALQAFLNSPHQVFVDPSGNVFFADTGNNRIRMVAPGTGIISTIAGSGSAVGYGGDGGPANSATLNAPYGIAMDPNGGGLLISDTGNNVIRRLSPMSGNQSPIITCANNIPFQFTVANASSGSGLMAFTNGKPGSPVPLVGTSMAYSFPAISNGQAQLQTSPDCQFVGPSGNMFNMLNIPQNLCGSATTSMKIQCGFGSPSTTASAQTSSGSNGSGGSGGQNSGSSALGVGPATSYSRLDTVKFSASTYIYSESAYSGANCTGDLISTRTENGAYTLGPANADGSLPTTIFTKASSGTIYTDGGVSNASARPKDAGCGIADWTVGAAQDLLNSQCSSPADQNGHQMLFLVNGNQLFMSDGPSKTVSTNHSMTRQ